MLQEILNGLDNLNLAGIYTRRLDWLFSGDDGEDRFFKRLKEELDGMEQVKQGITKVEGLEL